MTLTEKLIELINVKPITEDDLAATAGDEEHERGEDRAEHGGLRVERGESYRSSFDVRRPQTEGNATRERR